MAIQWRRILPFLILSQCLIWISIYYFPFQVDWSWENHHLEIYIPSDDGDVLEDPIISSEPEESLIQSNITVISLPTRPAIIAPRFQKADVDWIYDFQIDYDIYIYQVDKPSADLPIPINKGHEAMVYLSFIIDNWETLPTYSLFIHGHLTSWHQLDGYMNDLIHDLQIPILQSEGYINFRCSGGFACEPQNYIHPRPNILGLIDYGNEEWPQIIDGIVDAWPVIFGEEEVLPKSIGSMCCAQFAVTREFIWRREKEVYVRARKWLMETKLEDKFSGRVLEKIWAYLMTGESIVCPSKEHCLCKYFGRCQGIDPESA